MTITALPPYPQRNDADFPDKADAHVAALPTWTSQVNALGVDVTNKQIAATASEVAAELAETNAETAQGLSEAARDLSIANASGTVAAGSSKDWASKAENSEVISGAYSALHWAAKAAASVAVLPAGTINDGLIAADKTWSSNKISGIVDDSLTATDKTWSSSKITAALSLFGMIEPSAKTATYTILLSDKSKLITGSGSFTFNIDSAITLGSGWFCYVQNIGISNITIDPFSTQTIDGQANVILEPGNLFLIISDGSNLKCVRLNKPQPHYITASETWICPAGVYEIDVELRGAGGGGGSGSNIAGTPLASGGGQGGYSIKKINISPGVSKVITIGSGGAGASSTSQNSGVAGSTSSFSSDITCSGGSGGTTTGTINSAIYSGGGSSSDGELNIYGQDGTAINFASYSLSISLGGGPSNSSGSGGYGSRYGVAGQAGQNGICIIWY